jgi:hypothetical protein
MQKDEYGLCEANDKIVKQLRRVLLWHGGRMSPLHSPAFWAEFDKLVELYDDAYGGHEEFT